MTRHPVWDPFIRLFHWALVAGFAANALFTDDDSTLHEWVGYAVVGLIAARLIWGLIGPRHARFADFLPSPRAALQQVQDIATGRHRVYLGHTPLGALMILNLLLTILLIGATGYMMTTNAFWGIDWVEGAHEGLVGWAEVSILVHIAAVILESFRTGVNLPQAMLTGVKSVPDDANIVT
jgi:cytochrome b